MTYDEAITVLRNPYVRDNTAIFVAATTIQARANASAEDRRAASMIADAIRILRTPRRRTILRRT
jgi:hypothetical protein